MASTQPTLRCAYRYDPLDQLINQIQSYSPALQRFYCKSRLTTEIQGATRHSIFQHGDQLLAQRKQDHSLNTTLLATDLQRSVLETLETNGRRQLYAYSPYGHHSSASGLLSLLGFNGERPDPLTGYYLLGNGYRAFNPALMRFNSPDNLSPFGKGGINAYVYCGSDPRNRVDTTGHNWLNVFLGKISNTLFDIDDPIHSELFKILKNTDLDIEKYSASRFSKKRENRILNSANRQIEKNISEATKTISKLSKAPESTLNTNLILSNALIIDSQTVNAWKISTIALNFDHPYSFKKYIQTIAARDEAIPILKKRLKPEHHNLFNKSTAYPLIRELRSD